MIFDKQFSACYTVFMANGKLTKLKEQIYPLISPRERLLAWESIAGIWKNKKPDPIKELQKMRREWDRKLPNLRDK